MTGTQSTFPVGAGEPELHAEAMKSLRIRHILIPTLLALGAALVYLPQLRDAPIYLGRDEMFFGLTAHSLASTGHDTTGRFMPLYFQTQMRYGSEMWFQPILMYAITFSVKLLGLSEGTIRLPMAIAGVVDVVLVYFIGRLLFDRQIPAVAASVLLALTPAHFIHSRVAMDFQTPLPFALGWLLCLLMYLRHGNISLLFTAGLLLGVGMFSYIAAWMLMPIYACLTCVVLHQRGEPLKRYLLLASGFVLPVLCGLPFLWRHPTVLHDIFWHYERNKPQMAGADELFAGFFTFDRFVNAASVYWRFWNPRFLFINGPQSMWAAGAFLLPSAGLLAIGLLHVLRRSARDAVLLIGGLLSAPIPASLVGDGEAIHRAAEVLPFGILLGAAGLDYIWSAERSRAHIIASMLACAIVIVLAATYHDDLRLAQAMVRAATVPIALAGFYFLLIHASDDRVRGQSAVVAVAALLAIQVAYLAAGYAIVAWSSGILAAFVAMVTVVREVTADRRITRLAVVLVLAAASSHFMYAYADYSHVHRVKFIPAAAIVLALRLTYAAGGLAIVTGIVLAARRVAVDRLSRAGLAGVAAVTILSIQVAYFYIDYFSDYRVRAIHATAVLAAAVAVAALLANSEMPRLGLGRLAIVALFGLASIQFTYFYVDYFTRYRVQSGNFEPEGNARAAWETVIERAGHRSVPAIYLGHVGPYGFSDLYWTFYAIKHDREDLLARTISDVEFEPDRIRSLPPASVVVTSPSPQTDTAIERMLSSGELRDKTLIRAADGASSFWILETGPRTRSALRDAK